MVIALSAKNKLKIVTGEYKEPESTSNLKPMWDRTNDMVISWILNTISDSISNTLSFVNTASALWKELNEHYAQLDGHRIYQVTVDVTQLKQSNTSVEVYYHRLKGFWDELDALEAPYACTCNCICENGKTNGEREQRKRLVQFLMGLDECYSNIRGQILLIQPLPTVAKAYSMIRQEEKQREGILPKPPTIPTALTANTHKYTPNTTYKKPTYSAKPNERKSPFRKGIFCDKCQKEGHVKKECYQIVGYPPGHPLYGKFKPYTSPKPSVHSTFCALLCSIPLTILDQCTHKNQLCIAEWTSCKTN
uniref:uncharacterized protein LOC122587871 n=1 Tax=Erigeron canadensis TaxID=72917 RepID=UPI001CB8CBFC|nr:uncharacterized protein LOC122587871 [Erigeron canadensis]